MPDKNWYRMKAMGGQRAALYIYGDIVSERWMDEDVSTASFKSDLDALGNVTNIDLHVNSPGGNVMAGLTIYSMLKQHPAIITAMIEGVAASIAGVVVCAADRVLISDAGMVMVHNPFAVAVGDANALRRQADNQDVAKASMIAAYQNRVAMTDEELSAAMDVETWYTAQEAVDLGFADGFIPAQQMAAKFDLSRFNHPPDHLGISKPVTGEQSMTTEAKKPAAESGDGALNSNAAASTDFNVQANIVNIEAAAEKRAREAEQSRVTEISTIFAKHSAHNTLMLQCITDSGCTAAMASKKLLDAIGESQESANVPNASRATTTVDERDKFRAAGTNALLARAKLEKDDTQNEFRGARIVDLMAHTMMLNGQNVKGLYSPSAIYNAMLASSGQTTSDFSVLLENVMHKMLISGASLAPHTWRMFCRVGSVSDFRAHNRYRMGNIGNIDTVQENGEFKHTKWNDAEKESITADNKGRLLGLTYEAMVNDDLGPLSDAAVGLGSAALRTVEADVYASLALNSNLGPTLTSDSKAIFHADHNNEGTAAAISPTSLDEARQLLLKQTAVGGNNDYLDIRPHCLLMPVSKRATAIQMVTSEGDPTSGNANSRKTNYVRDIVAEANIIDTPRLTGNRWYMFADPAIEPVMEVAFLDGNETPMITSQEMFNSAGVTYRVMFSYGVAGVGYRGAVMNDGA